MQSWVVLRQTLWFTPLVAMERATQRTLALGASPARSSHIPVVEKMPPTMPHSRTRNCQKGMCCSVTVTISELRSYFMKIPETPWLPAAWLITRSCSAEAGTGTEITDQGGSHPQRHVILHTTTDWLRSYPRGLLLKHSILMLFPFLDTTYVFLFIGDAKCACNKEKSEIWAGFMNVRQLW